MDIDIPTELKNVDIDLNINPEPIIDDEIGHVDTSILNEVEDSTTIGLKLTFF
jgi:hypothetical protein